MDDNRLVITETGFLTEFLNQHTQRIDRPFCFILGAGVSRSSGIPTGDELAKVWLQELFEAENFGGLSVDEWAKPERLGIEKFDLANLALFYPQLYRLRYGDHEQAGYAFLESQMEGKEPSYGYSVLSYLLSETSHRVVITTNFDNLVADALSIHSSRFPLVIGHDALAQYAAVELRRPLVAKIHGALGFSPKSQPDEISALSEGWRSALGRILERYTPIVIGYEGNDGSLMGFLQSLPAHIPDRVLWCVYAPGANASECLNLVSEDVRKYVRSRRGRFIPIKGFDELMARLLTKLREKGSVPDLYERLKERARQRERSYDEQQRKLFESAVVTEPPDKNDRVISARKKPDVALSAAVSEIAESRKEKPWWVWYEDAKAASDVDAKQNIYLQGVTALPDNSDMLRSYALFLDEIGDVTQADTFYQRAVNANPRDVMSLTFYGTFLQRAGKLDAAEEHFKRVLEVNPNYTYGLTRYGSYLERVRGDMDKAEEMYVRALNVNPKDRYVIEAYAEFLRTVRADPEKAEKIELAANAINAIS